MDKDEIIKMMSDAGLKAPARGDFIFIHWDQIAMLLNYEREACIEKCKPYGLTGECVAIAIRARGN